MPKETTKQAYAIAKERYAALGIDTEKVLVQLQNFHLSMHCWQGDDVIGFDHDGPLTGGIQTTGNYPGKATTPDQLMADLDKAFSYMPGKNKLNLHASYAIFEDGEAVGRNALDPKHFAKWVEFARKTSSIIIFDSAYEAYISGDEPKSIYEKSSLHSGLLFLFLLSVDSNTIQTKIYLANQSMCAIRLNQCAVVKNIHFRTTRNIFRLS